MEHLHGPQTQVHEGAYAIKVSMRFALRNSSLFILLRTVHGPCHVFWGFTISQPLPVCHRVDASYLGIRRTPVWSPEVVGWAFFYPHLIDHSES